MIENILKTFLVGLVEDKDSVQVSLENDEKKVYVHVKVANQDIGRVIGKNGKVINALTTIIHSITYKDQPRKKYIIRINEGQR